MEQSKMKAAVYMGRKDVRIKEMEIPELGDRDVLIKNVYSSICGTDVAVYTHGPDTGHKVDVGGEFGHETISVVAAAGRKVKDFKPGQRVYPYPYYAKGDTKRAGTLGGFSEYIHIPNARKGHSLYEVDERISDRAGCLIEPFTVGCRAARQGRPRPGEKAAVFGCGTIGIAAAIALKYFGVESVMICDLSDFRLDIAGKMGFQVCNTAREDFAAKAEAYFGRAESLNGPVPDVDLFIDAAGAESVLNLFMESGKIGSRFVIVAVNNVRREIDLLHLTYAQKSIVGSGGYMPEDVRDVMEIMKSGRWDIESIITHEFDLDDIAEAIETAADPQKALNVTVRFQNDR